VNQLAKLKKIWNKYTEGWTGAVVYLIIGFVVAFMLNNVILVYALNTNTPVVAVFSGSMEPTFYKGDMIVVKGVENVSIGDIIVFDVPNKQYPIIHRVYEIDNNIILTKGDNNMNVDPWRTSVNNIHGKAIVKIPVLGWVKIIFNRVTGL
jgi:signal peptidase